MDDIRQSLKIIREFDRIDEFNPLSALGNIGRKKKPEPEVEVEEPTNEPEIDFEDIWKEYKNKANLPKEPNMVNIETLTNFVKSKKDIDEGSVLEVISSIAGKDMFNMKQVDTETIGKPALAKLLDTEYTPNIPAEEPEIADDASLNDIMAAKSDGEETSEDATAKELVLYLRNKLEMPDEEIDKIIQAAKIDLGSDEPIGSDSVGIITQMSSEYIKNRDSGTEVDSDTEIASNTQTDSEDEVIAGYIKYAADKFQTGRAVLNAAQQALDSGGEGLSDLQKLGAAYILTNKAKFGGK